MWLHHLNLSPYCHAHHAVFTVGERDVCQCGWTGPKEKSMPKGMTFGEMAKGYRWDGHSFNECEETGQCPQHRTTEDDMNDQDVGLGIFEDMYEEGEPVLIPEWVVRVGRPEDKSYQYVRKDDSIQYSLTHDVNEAHVFREEKEAWKYALQWTWGHGHDRNSVVKEEKGYLQVLQGGFVEDNFCIMVQCDDYDHFKRLPAAVSFNGKLLGKTGWNSDTHRCHYQENAQLAKEV